VSIAGSGASASDSRARYQKSVGYFRPQRVNDLYSALESIVQTEGTKATVVCETLDLSRSAYYAWRTRLPSERQARDEDLAVKVRDIFWRHRRRYGARRIAAELKDLGQSCERRHVAKLLHLQGLRATQPKSCVPKTTASRNRLGYSPNLLLETPEPCASNHIWVGDITYVPLCGERFCYLATLMDRYSRRIVGWHIDEMMTEQLVIPALHGAIQERQPPSQLIHHTDRGGQYASRRYRAILRRAEIRQSMNRADNCYDNAFMESCFGTFKTELEMTEYKHHRVAKREIGDYIAYHNLDRRHSALRYCSPYQFELLQ
jgi:putative transposase